MWAHSKSPHVTELVLEYLRQDRVRFSSHALDRLKQRLIPRGLDETDVLRILRLGRREIGKDSWDSVFFDWTYAFKGKCLDGIEIRVVVSITDEVALVVTVIDLD